MNLYTYVYTCMVSPSVKAPKLGVRTLGGDEKRRLTSIMSQRRDQITSRFETERDDIYDLPQCATS